MFKEQNIAINGIETIEDLRQLPVTTKYDLQKYSEDFICVEESSYRLCNYIGDSGRSHHICSHRQRSRPLRL